MHHLAYAEALHMVSAACNSESLTLPPVRCLLGVGFALLFYAHNKWVTARHVLTEMRESFHSLSDPGSEVGSAVTLTGSLLFPTHLAVLSGPQPVSCRAYGSPGSAHSSSNPWRRVTSEG
jgi:hypothetical protein